MKDLLRDGLCTVRVCSFAEYCFDFFLFVLVEVSELWRWKNPVGILPVEDHMNIAVGV